MRRFLAVVMFSAPLMTIADTGNELQKRCQSQPATVDAAYCLGYIRGVVETHSSWRFRYELDPAHFLIDESNDAKRWKALQDEMLGPPKYCIPKGVTLGQMEKVIVKYLNENPAQLHLAAERLIERALTQAFACQGTE